jgi:hypothetical protein
VAFMVQCPFCKLRARVPDRATGAVGRCPKCANSFTLASVDDQRLPESADEPDVEPIAASAVNVAIAVAAATVEAPRPVDPFAAEAPCSTSSGFEPAAAAGALALLLGGLALVCGAVSFLRGLVLPLSGLGVLIGFAAIGLARLSSWPRLILPILGSAAAAAMLIVAWLFPALLGPAYEHARQRTAPTPVGLHAVPLAGAPALADLPDWVDARRYALERDGLRVQIIHAALLHQPATDAKPAQDLLLVRVRISQQRGATKPLERKEQPAPTLADDVGQTFALRQCEFFNAGDGKSKSSIFPVPTLEETFAFDAPGDGSGKLRLALPAARWGENGEFRFTISVAGGPLPQKKGK